MCIQSSPALHRALLALRQADKVLSGLWTWLDAGKSVFPEEGIAELRKTFPHFRPAEHDPNFLESVIDASGYVSANVFLLEVLLEVDVHEYPVLPIRTEWPGDLNPPGALTAIELLKVASAYVEEHVDGHHSQEEPYCDDCLTFRGIYAGLASVATLLDGDTSTEGDIDDDERRKIIRSQLDAVADAGWAIPRTLCMVCDQPCDPGEKVHAACLPVSAAKARAEWEARPAKLPLDRANLRHFPAALRLAEVAIDGMLVQPDDVGTDEVERLAKQARHFIRHLRRWVHLPDAPALATFEELVAHEKGEGNWPGHPAASGLLCVCCQLLDGGMQACEEDSPEYELLSAVYLGVSTASADLESFVVRPILADAAGNAIAKAFGIPFRAREWPWLTAQDGEDADEPTLVPAGE